MNIKHSKYKNTGILFELLVRQVTADTLNGGQSAALNIIKKYFVKSELGKELKLYESLNKNTQLHESRANLLVQTLLESSQKLNRGILRREKYNLINEIKKYYNLEEFFKTKLPNYKAYASFYNLIEISNSSAFVNPDQLISNKITLLEYLSVERIDQTKVKDDLISEYKTYDKDLRILAYKILLEKFNGKYSNFYSSQKEILKEFITSVDSTPKLKNFYNNKIKEFKLELNELSTQVQNQVVAIKLSEVVPLIKEVDKNTPITNDHVVNLLQYAELIEELKVANEGSEK
jgi:hypothetical protein